jgi:type I restriction enzyme S subunit
VTADIKPYPAYKDSGVPWLGQVPDHWTLLHGRACFREKKVVNAGMRQTTVLSLSYGQIVIKPVEKLHGLVPASFETYQVIDEGDIVVRPTDLQNDWNSLRFGLSSHRGIITSAYMCLSTLDTLTRNYGFLLLHAYDLKKVFYGLGSGLRQNLDWGDFKYLPCVVPPVSEQAAIVRYLDHADRKVRHAIRARQQLIKLLTEQKQAIIQRAVTRGLDPNVRLKPSGVAWIGDVPEHWAISRVKDEFNCLDRRRIPLSGVERGAMSSQQYDYYGASGIIDKVADFLFDDKLLLIAEDGANLVLRNLPLAIIARGKFWVNNHAHILKPKQGNIEYLSAVMEMLNYQLWISGAAQPKLTQDRLMSIALAIPPRDEQDQIIANVQEKTVSLRHAIDAARREIDLLREYRTRLIADVVTGKLDVRDVVVPDDETDVLPEELESIDNVEATDESDDAVEADSGAEESA